MAGSKTKLGQASSTGIFATQKKNALTGAAARVADRQAHGKVAAPVKSKVAAKPRVNATLAQTQKDAKAPPNPKSYNFNTPAGFANYQADLNKYNNAKSLLTNRVNATNAYGSNEYIQNADGTVTRKTDLSAAQQKALDTIQGGAQTSLNQVTQNYAQPLNYDNVTKVAGADDLRKFQEDTTNQVFNSLKGRADIQTKNLTKDFDQKMADQGIPIGSDLYNRLRTQNVDQPTNDLYNQLQAQAVQTGQQQAQQTYGQSLQSHQQGVQDTTNLYNAPAQNAAALYGLQNTGIVNPQYDPTYNQQYGATDLNTAASAYGSQVGAGATTSAAQTAAGASIAGHNIDAAGNLAVVKAGQPSVGAQVGQMAGTIGGSILTAVAPSMFNYAMGASKGVGPIDAGSSLSGVDPSQLTTF